MSGFFKALALLIAIACAVWVGVLWRWQATQRDMSVQDIATYLVALPLTLFALALLARWAWRGAVDRAALQAAPAAAAAPSATSAGTAGSATGTGIGIGADTHHAMPLLVLSAQVHCAAGSSTQAVLAAAAEGQPRPQLDPELVDDDGMPLLTARIAALELDAVDLSAALADVRALRPAWAEADIADTTLRALAALVLPLQACLGDLQPWRHRFGQVADAGVPPLGGLAQPWPPVSVGAHEPPRPPGAQTAPAWPAPGGPVPRRNAVLRVLPSWPADWPAFDAAVATAWLKRELAAAEVAAPDRIVFVAAPPGQTGAAAGTGDTSGGAAGWLEAERLMRMLAHDGQSDVLLLATCHSAIGAQAVQRLQAARQLFTARSPRLPLPGEAAAVLALAPVGWAAPDGTGLPDPAADAPPLATLHRAAVALRDQAVDAPGRAGAQAAQACIAQALAAGASAAPHGTNLAAAAPAATPAAANVSAQAMATDAGAAIHDADQHTARSAEALTALLHCLPQLQPGEDVLQTGALNGQIGVAAVPLLLALAAAQAQALQQPCLALSVDDARTRLALLARPFVATPVDAGPPTTGAGPAAPAPAAA